MITSCWCGLLLLGCLGLVQPADKFEAAPFVASTNNAVHALDCLFPPAAFQQQRQQQHHRQPSQPQPSWPQDKLLCLLQLLQSEDAKELQGSMRVKGCAVTSEVQGAVRQLQTEARSSSNREQGGREGSWGTIFSGASSGGMEARDPTFEELISGRIPQRPPSLMDLLTSIEPTAPLPAGAGLLPGASELLNSLGSEESIAALNILSGAFELVGSIFDVLHYSGEIAEFSLEIVLEGGHLLVEPALWITRLQQAVNEGLPIQRRQDWLGDAWISLLLLVAQRLKVVSTEQRSYQSFIEQLRGSESLLRRTLERFRHPSEGEKQQQGQEGAGSVTDFAEQLERIGRGGGGERGGSESGSGGSEGASNLLEDGERLTQEVQRGVLEGVRRVQEEINRTGESSSGRLVEAWRSGMEETSSTLREAVSSIGEEAVKQGAEAALRLLEESASRFVENAVKGAREARKRVVEGARGVSEEARSLGEEVQREMLKEVVKEAVKLLRRGVEQVRKAGEEGREISEEVSREVAKEVAKQVVKLLKRVAEEGESAGEEATKLAEEVGRELAKRAGEAFQRGLEEAEKAAEEGRKEAESVGEEGRKEAERVGEEGRKEAEKAAEEVRKEAEKARAEAVRAGMEEAMRVVEEFLQRGLEEWYRAAEERGSEPSQGASEVMTRVAEVLRAAAAEEPSSAERGDGGGDAKPPAEHVAESIGEALAQGVGVAIKGNSSKEAGATGFLAENKGGSVQFGDTKS